MSERPERSESVVKAARQGAGNPADQDGERQAAALLSALTTEHFVLQTAASSTITEAAARGSLYMLSLSASLVGLGFTSGSPDVFRPFAAAVLPGVFILGLLTTSRLVDLALENTEYLAGIARIRSHYRTLAPDAARLFAPEFGRWPESTNVPSLRLGSVIAFLGTTACMVAFMNSIVAGVGVALLVGISAGSATARAAMVSGVVTTAVLVALFLLFQRWRFRSVPG